jgi:hypothetical protein
MGYDTSPTKQNILTLLSSINHITKVPDTNLTDAVRTLYNYVRKNRYVSANAYVIYNDIYRMPIYYGDKIERSERFEIPYNMGNVISSYLYGDNPISDSIITSYICRPNIGFTATEITD